MLENDEALMLLDMPRQPGFLGGEAQDRREPANQAIKGAVQHRAGGTAARIVDAVAIEPVLADVEIEGAEIDRAEIVKRGEQAVEIIVGDRLPHQPVELGQAM